MVIQSKVIAWTLYRAKRKEVQLHHQLMNAILNLPSLIQTKIDSVKVMIHQEKCPYE